MPEAGAIEVVLPGESNAISSHAHPILETGNLSFPGGRYLVEFEWAEGDEAFHLSHRLEGAPLLHRLIEERKAKYACIVSSPRSAYRRVFTSSEPTQTVRCDSSNLGEPPLFTPALLCVRACEVQLESSRDGVHRIWNGRTVSFEEGSRLALGNVMELEASVEQLLSLHSDDRLHEGGFAIEINTEPFGFRANLHPKLHHFLRYGDRQLREPVMIHIVTACLARLQRDYSAANEEDGDATWESRRELKALAKHLQDRDLLHWTAEEFRPEEVATALYPITIPTAGETHESDDDA